MALEIIPPTPINHWHFVPAVEHNTHFPRYDDGQLPEWCESEVCSEINRPWYTWGGGVNEDAYGAYGAYVADGVDGFGCTDDEYFASRASEARWLEGQQIIRNAQYADPTTPDPTPTTPAPAPAQNECSYCPDSLIGLHPDVDVYGDADSEIVSPEEYALVQSHRAATEATAGCYEGCMCDKDGISYGPGPWFHSTVSLDEYELIQAYRLQQTHQVTAFPQEPQQQESGYTEEEELGFYEDDDNDNDNDNADLSQPHWGSMGDRLGGDDLAGINLATPSWVNKTSSFPFLINEDNKENEGEVMWSSSSSKCNTTFRETPGGAGAVGLDDADYGAYAYAGAGATSTLTSPLLTSPNSNPLGFHIVHEQLTEYTEYSDDDDLTEYSDGEGDGEGDPYW